MRCARSSVLGALLLAVAPAAPAAEAGSAPLESTKQELRQLEGTQKNKGGITPAGGVKIDPPALDVRSAETQAVKQWTERQKKEEQQRQQQRRKAANWLVNGVEQLGREGEAGTAATPGQLLENDPDSRVGADSSDPQYLLKLFDEQEKRSKPKETAPRPHAAAAPNPFAPFLQGWLASSPVRDQVTEQFRTGTEPAGGAFAPGGAAGFSPPAATGGPSLANLANQGATAEAKPNPYLVELNPSIVATNPIAQVAALPANDLAQALSTPATAPLTMVAPDPLPDARAPAKGPPPGLADDKKYFPQLKKF